MSKFLARQVFRINLPKYSGDVKKWLFSGTARNCVKMILLTNDTEKVIAMLTRNYGRSEKIVEQLLEEAKTQKPVTNSNDFQEFSNLVENLSVTVENVGKLSQFTNKIVIRELLNKLPEHLRLQREQYLVHVRTHDVNIEQYVDWVSTQNEIVSKVEIRNEATTYDDI
jgi:hypothetical protein